MRIQGAINFAINLNANQHDIPATSTLMKFGVIATVLDDSV